MSVFDADKLNREFFPERQVKVNLRWQPGYGESKQLHPRQASAEVSSKHTYSIRVEARQHQSFKVRNLHGHTPSSEKEDEVVSLNELRIGQVRRPPSTSLRRTGEVSVWNSARELENQARAYEIVSRKRRTNQAVSLDDCSKRETRTRTRQRGVLRRAAGGLQ